MAMTASPAAAKGERTRAALVEAAVARFATEGFQRTSVADIARVVGVSPAAVYRYFPDKEALFIAAVDADAEALVELIRAELSDAFTESLASAGPVIAKRFMAALRDHPLVSRVLRGAEPMSPERIHALPRLAELRSRVTEVLELGQGSGLIRTDIDAATTALGLETILLYQLGHLATLREPNARTESARWSAVAAVIEAALRPPRPA